jgi:hypothetical protein
VLKQMKKNINGLFSFKAEFCIQCSLDLVMLGSVFMCSLDLLNLGAFTLVHSLWCIHLVAFH